MDNIAAEPILEQTPQLSLTIGMLLCPDFNGMAAHAFIDLFRAANYVQGGVRYQWQYLSLRGDTEIAGVCRFSSVEHLARAYKKRFDIAPSKDRIEGRIPFQFRTFPRYAGI